MKKKEISKEERISREIERLSNLFSDADENKKEIISTLIQNAGFMRIALEDLQEIINRDGTVERYQNGANQFGIKQSAAVQSYNALVKNYAAVIKTLSGIIPPVHKPSDAELYIEAYKLSANAAKEGRENFQDFRMHRAMERRQAAEQEEE